MGWSADTKARKGMLCAWGPTHVETIWAQQKQGVTNNQLITRPSSLITEAFRYCVVIRHKAVIMLCYAFVGQMKLMVQKLSAPSALKDVSLQPAQYMFH